MSRKRVMRTRAGLWIAVAALLVLSTVTACARPSPTPTQQPAATSAPTSTTQLTATQTPQPTATTAPTSTPTPAPPLTWAQLENAAYPNEWPQEGVAQLTGGSYEEPMQEGAATKLTVTLGETYATGDLNRDGSEDAAVILVVNPGGSGTFFYLTAVFNQAGAPQAAATVSLGDRPRIRSLSIEPGQVVLEMVTHGADDPLCCPTQIVRNEYAVVGEELAEVASEVIGTVEAPTPAGAPLTLDALRSATYPSELEESGAITLTDGVYEGQPFVEGGASRLVVTLVEPAAFGDLDGDGIDDAAVVLAANAGGSGTFVSLEAVRNEAGQPVHAATTDLGDRAQIESLAIEGGQVVLEMVTHGPDDPMCCPTQRVRNSYALEGSELVEAASEVIAPDERAEAAPGDVAGVIWTWQHAVAAAGQEETVVPYPPAYRLELLPQEEFSFQADCNVGSGVYYLDADVLALAPGPVTLAECGPGSLADEFVGLLLETATYVRQGDILTLDLREDGGQMTFSKLHAVTGRVVAPANGLLPPNATLEVKVLDVTQGEPGTQVGGVSKEATGLDIAFEAPYNPEAIRPGSSYVLEVTIKDEEGNPSFSSLEPYPVLTQGHPTYHVEVSVE